MVFVALASKPMYNSSHNPSRAARIGHQRSAEAGRQSSSAVAGRMNWDGQSSPSVEKGNDFPTSA